MTWIKSNQVLWWGRNELDNHVVLAIDPTGKALSEVYSLQKWVVNRDPISSMCGAYNDTDSGLMVD